MTTEMKSNEAGRRDALRAITIGGLFAGTIDLTSACIEIGWNTPLIISHGLLGPQAEHGGAGTWLLGVLLHFFITFTCAAIYFAVSRKLSFLVTHWVLSGLLFGAIVTYVMDAIVMPLSQIHRQGFDNFPDLLDGMYAHMVLIGLPIAFCVWKFGNSLKSVEG